MARKWLIGIGLIVLVVGALFLTGIIPLPESNTSSMEIIFYDAEGNELGRTDTRLSIFGIQNPGFEGDIYSLEVVMYFTVTTNADVAASASVGWLEIRTEANIREPYVVYSIAEHSLGARNTDLEGTFYATYLMETLLPESMMTQECKDGAGWIMYFDGKVVTSIESTQGDRITAEDTCKTTLSIQWVESTLSVESWFGGW